MEAVGEALTRWAGTYLMPEEAPRGPLGTAFGREGQGPEVLAVIVRLCNTLLTSCDPRPHNMPFTRAKAKSFMDSDAGGFQCLFGFSLVRRICDHFPDPCVHTCTPGLKK